MALRFLRQSSAQRRELILKGHLPSTIMVLSFPVLLMGLVQAVIPIVDGLFINNIVGTVAASAVFYSAPLVNLFNALAQGLSVAGMAIIGHAVGKGDIRDARQVAIQMSVVAFLAGLAMIPVMIGVAFPVSAQVNPDIAQAVFQYMALSALVLPFSFVGAVYNAIKNGNGRPEDTFIRIIILLALKVAFNALFIWLLDWGLVGAVMSTLVSSILISVWMYFEMFQKPGPDRLSLAGFRFDRPILRELVQIGFPSMLSSVILSMGFFLINIEIQKYGAVILNGAGIASNISNLCFLIPSSFGSAITTLVSMNVGASQPQRARTACLLGCIISSVTALLLTAVIVPTRSYLTLLFTRQEDVLAIANDALSIYIYAVVGFGISMVLQGAFIGLGRTRVTILISILRVWLLRYLFILITEPFLGYEAVFWGSLFSNYMTAVITVIMILRVKWVSVIPQRTTVADTTPSG